MLLVSVFIVHYRTCVLVAQEDVIFAGLAERVLLR